MKKGKVIEKKVGFFGGQKATVKWEDGTEQTFKLSVHEGYMFVRGTEVELDEKGRINPVKGGAAPNPFTGQ